MMGALVKQRQALPFLTDTATLYSGMRNQAVSHIELAQRHGFGFENTGLPLIMADGLTGDEELEVPIPGPDLPEGQDRLADRQGPGPGRGFPFHRPPGLRLRRGPEKHGHGLRQPPRQAGAAFDRHAVGEKEKMHRLRRLRQLVPGPGHHHGRRGRPRSTSRPASAAPNALPSAASTPSATTGRRPTSSCSARSSNTPGAWPLAKKDKAIYINFLNRISKDCDCMGGYKKIVPDIGVLIAFDPVALDAASLDLVEKKAGKPLTALLLRHPPPRPDRLRPRDRLRQPRLPAGAI